jgi:hypothetical protein
MYQIIETDVYGDVPNDSDERCYLNHAYLHSFSFGSQDMAWQGNTELEAEGMLRRMTNAGKFRPCKVVQTA